MKNGDVVPAGADLEMEVHVIAIWGDDYESGNDQYPCSSAQAYL